GFNHSLKEHNITLNKACEFINEVDNIEAGRKMGKVYLSDKKHRPTAIFACNDLIAAGVIRVAKEHHLEVPKDFSIVGFDNTSIASIIESGLTTVAQPIKGMGKEVVDLMISIIKGEKKDYSRITLLPSLVERKTTSLLQMKI